MFKLNTRFWIFFVLMILIFLPSGMRPYIEHPEDIKTYWDYAEVIGKVVYLSGGYFTLSFILNLMCKKLFKES